MQTQRAITIFLASSEELINDRNSFQALIASLDDIYEERGIRIKCKRWEDFNAYCTGERTQDQYNKVVRASDVCICMFHRKAGEFTKEEFHHALNEYRQNNDHPKTYVYVRALVEGEVEEEELKAFKDELFKTIGHYWCNYVTEDAMKLHFVMQLERMMTPAFSSMDSQSDNLKVENGNVLLYGRKIADFSNLSFAACNTEYISLKEKIEHLDKEIIQFRAMGIAELKPVISEKSAERNQYQEELKKLEEQLFQIALSVNKVTSSGTPVSERKRMAIEMFEKGNIKGVIEVLNEDDMAADAERAETEISHGKQLVEAGNEMVESGIQKIRALVDEYVMKAKALMADFTESNRFNLACQAYERAIALTRKHLTDEELSQKLFETATFLYRNKDFDKAEVYFLECLKKRRRLACEKSHLCDYYKSKVAEVLHNLANVYRKTQRLSKSEELYKEALEIYSRIAEKKTHHDFYEPFVAATLNNLAILYSTMQRFSESEKMNKEALEIFYRLAEKTPLVYEKNVALSLESLAVTYYSAFRFTESEKMHKEALVILRRLAENNPQTYKPDIAGSLHNLANLYTITQRYFESERMHKEALEINRSLAENSSQEYLPSVASSLSNLATVYNKIQRFSESETMYKEALKIRRRLAIDLQQTYEPDFAETLNGFALLYFVTQRFSESEAMYKEALEIRRRLAIDLPQTYEPYLAETLNNLALLYTATQRFSESEAMYKEALEIRRRLAIDLPQTYEPYLAETLNGFALLYSSTERFSESEVMYKEALGISRRLVVGSPQTFEPFLAELLKNLALLYFDTLRFSECEKMYKESLEIYRRLADRNSELYESYVAYILIGLAELYFKTQCFLKSEGACIEALDIFRHLAKDNLQTYELEIVWGLTNLASNSILLSKYAEAEQYARNGLEIESTNLDLYSNLAPSLLFQGKFDEAEQIYCQYKDELIETFLNNFDEFERAEAIPCEYKKDVERIKIMLKE